jgi:hypothetical protein
MTTKDKILITLASLATATYLFFLFRKKSKTKTNMSNIKSISGGLILSVPSTKNDNYPLLVMFSGISYATPEWLYKQIPLSVLYNAVVIIAPYSKSYESIKPAIASFISKNNLQISSTSLFGFSAGGLQVQKAYSPSFKFVGMIDPSIRPEYATKAYTSNVALMYNLQNWAGVFKSFDYKKAYASLESNIAQSGGHAENIVEKHPNFPKLFFDKYQEKFM